MLMVCGAVVCMAFAHAASNDVAAPTFQALMDPSMFPDAHRGMVVESAGMKDGALRIVTTGAELALDMTGKAVFRQRIGRARDVVTLQIEGGIERAPKLTHSGPGLAFARFEAPRFDLRANGDSLFMLHVHEPLGVTVTRAIDVGFTASFESNHLLLDEWGGFGIYCSEKTLNAAFDPYGPVTARYDLPADSVLWIGVCPPKPYDWDRSITDHVVWHWSNQLGYPPDDELVAWSKEGNVVLLQSEVMLWKDWNVAFEPRLGEAEFARVRNTMHEHGTRFIVYTSPYYFLKGTALEPRALNSFENFKGWPPGSPTGENMELFMAAITKVMREYKPDGLYFDGQYTSNPAALYALARRTRALLGEDGILEWHSTAALGGGRCMLPHADAYVDFILRGEGRDSVYADFDYLRYFVSCYNVSNSIGVICNNHGSPTADLVQRLLEANCRMHTIAGWLDDPATVDVIHNTYRARLTPALRAQVERDAAERQRGVADRAKNLARERAALMAPPDWDAPILAESFDALPDWESVVSPQNGDPFAIEEGALAVTGKAHTYAFLTGTLTGKCRGLMVKLRQHTDGGMSWGPGACLRWKDGAVLRIGVRTDGRLQWDINGQQRLSIKPECDREKWIWLRARWVEHSGVIELSRDGIQFEHVWTFDHGGTLTGEVAGVSVGKVPYNGQPQDHSTPGAPGTCFLDDLEVY